MTCFAAYPAVVQSKPIIPPIWLFVRWLGSWRRHERWEYWGRVRNDPRYRCFWPFKDKDDPWTAIVNHLSSRTGISAQAVERYMAGCTDEGEPTNDTFTQRELHKWWESGQGTDVIYRFQQNYPDLAKLADFLPKVGEADVRAAAAGDKDGGSMTQKIEVKDSPGTTVNQVIGSSNRTSQNQAKEGFLQQIVRQVVRWFSGLTSRPNKPKGT